jgi:hypothetical protein
MSILKDAVYTEKNFFLFTISLNPKYFKISYFLSCLRQFNKEFEGGSFTLRRAKFLGRKLISSMNVLDKHSGH